MDKIAAMLLISIEGHDRGAIIVTYMRDVDKYAIQTCHAMGSRTLDRDLLFDRCKCTIIISRLLYTTVPLLFFADCQKQSAKVLKQMAKALPTVLHVAVGKKHPTKILSAKKPLPPAKRKAVGKVFATCQYGSRQKEQTPL